MRIERTGSSERSAKGCSRTVSLRGGVLRIGLGMGVGRQVRLEWCLFGLLWRYTVVGWIHCRNLWKCNARHSCCRPTSLPARAPTLLPTPCTPSAPVEAVWHVCRWQRVPRVAGPLHVDVHVPRQDVVPHAGDAVAVQQPEAGGHAAGRALGGGAGQRGHDAVGGAVGVPGGRREECQQE